MRNRALHDALRDFALEAAALLVRATDAGAEIGYALDEQRQGSATLYRYRPLTDEFIAARWTELRALPAFDPAARTLGSGARSYLRRRGEPGADAEPALRMMLERLYEDATSFAFPEERFERVYAGVERALYAGTIRATVVAPVIGLRLEGARVELGSELALADVSLLEGAPSPSRHDLHDAGEEAAPVTTYLVLERDVAADASLPLAEARVRFRSAVLALRLLERGGVALGPLAFARTGEGAWQALRLGPTGYARGPECSLETEAGHDLRQLLDAVESGRAHGSVAWALGRFEMGVEREHDVEALSDYLLALRALLDAGPASDPTSVALRLAALCAEEGDRRAVQRRIESAFALEPFVVDGGADEAQCQRYADESGGDGPHALVLELEEALRQLLWGVLTGEREAELQGRADEILLRAGAPLEIRARRFEGEGDEEAEDGDSAEVEALRSTPGGADAEAQHGETGADPAPSARQRSGRAAGAPRARRGDELEGGQAPLRLAAVDGLLAADGLGSTDFDWGLDEEGASYSAPV
jgi:hypothetical protein